jgi:hypothetical protein
MKSWIICWLLLGTTPVWAGQEHELTKAEQAQIAEALYAESKAPETNEALKPMGTASMMNPSMALMANFSLAYFNTKTPLQLGAHDPDHTGFNLDHFEWHIEGKVDHYFEMQANLVFMESGVELEELYAQTLSMPASLQVRVGQFLLPFGRLNQTHPHSRRFPDQNLVIGKFLGSEGARGFLLGSSYMRGENKSANHKLTHLIGADFLVKYTPKDSKNRFFTSLQIEWMHRQREIPKELLNDNGGYAELIVGHQYRWEVDARLIGWVVSKMIHWTRIGTSRVLATVFREPGIQAIFQG